MPVDYDILPLQLSDFVKSIMAPHLTSLCPGFPWDLSSMEVWEFKIWQDVLKMPLSLPYFFGKFLKTKPGTKKDAGQVVFSPHSQPLEFVLVIDSNQWLQSEGFMMEEEETSMVVEQRPHTPPVPVSQCSSIISIIYYHSMSYLHSFLLFFL